MLYVLGSRSPRRRDLLSPFLAADELLILPPRQSAEAGFERLHDPGQIEPQLQAIVNSKMEDVRQQMADDSTLSRRPCCIIAADTIVVAEDPDTGPIVLGQPDPANWQSEVRDWMLRLYSARPHEVWTGFRIVCGSRSVAEVVKTTVWFRELTPDLVSSYLTTKESIGKAGGYGIQGAAATFVSRIDGSLTNVIGLPIAELLEAMTTIGARPGA